MRRNHLHDHLEDVPRAVRVIVKDPLRLNALRDHSLRQSEDTFRRKDPVHSKVMTKNLHPGVPRSHNRPTTRSTTHWTMTSLLMKCLCGTLPAGSTRTPSRIGPPSRKWRPLQRPSFLHLHLRHGVGETLIGVERRGESPVIQIGSRAPGRAEHRMCPPYSLTWTSQLPRQLRRPLICARRTAIP